LGDQPFSNQSVTKIVTKNNGKGWPWMHFYTPENWVAMLDVNGKGIGVFQPEVMYFNAGFHGGDDLKGYGGEQDGQTGHIAPVGTQILDYNIRWTYKTSLVLGTVDDIRTYAKQHWQVVTCPEWIFSNSRKNWYYQGNIFDAGYPIQKQLDITFQQGASMIGPLTFWKATDAPVLEIEGAFETASGEITLVAEIQPVGKSDFTEWLNWSEGDQDQEAEKREKAAEFPETPSFTVSEKVQADGDNRIYRIHLDSIPEYTGVGKSLKISFSEAGTAKIKRIKLGEDTTDPIDPPDTTAILPVKPFNLNPNPTNGIVNIDNVKGEVIDIYTISGSLLFRTNASVIDLSAYPAGVYLIRKGAKVGKLIKN
jgi:hypothetical protein